MENTRTRNRYTKKLKKVNAEGRITVAKGLWNITGKDFRFFCIHSLARSLAHSFPFDCKNWMRRMRGGRSVGLDRSVVVVVVVVREWRSVADILNLFRSFSVNLLVSISVSVCVFVVGHSLIISIHTNTHTLTHITHRHTIHCFIFMFFAVPSMYFIQFVVDKPFVCVGVLMMMMLMLLLLLKLFLFYVQL